MKNKIYNQDNKISNLENTVDQNRQTFDIQIKDCGDNISDLFNKTSRGLELLASFKEKYETEIANVNSGISMNSVQNQSQQNYFGEIIKKLSELIEKEH